MKSFPLRRTVWLALLLAPAGSVCASDAEIKLAFAYNFAKFTEWPERALPRGGVELCVATEEQEYQAALRGLAGRSVRGLPLRTRLVVRPGEVAGCQVVFVPEGDSRLAAELAYAAQNAGALSVSDQEAFLRLGGMVGLVSSQGRLQFEIDQEAAARAGLQLHAQLLKLARWVRKARP